VPLSNKYKLNWPDTQERFERWWLRQPTDRPLLRVTARRRQPLGNTPRPSDPSCPQIYLDTGYLIQKHRHTFETTYYGGDAFPNVNANLGPGSLALYLGSEPVFDPRTVWFKPCIKSLDDTPLPEFNPANHWLRIHLDLIRRLQEAFFPDAYVAIPDLIESLDILAAMRDPMTLLYDLKDRPVACHRWLQRINALYAPHYDTFYNIVRDSDGSSVFTAFEIWGPGKTCKVQCDFAAMISPDQFAEFYVPYLRDQIRGLNRVLYHLDGPSCICHVDLLLTIERLHAIQWVPGAGQPDCSDERWYPLYEKILNGGKGLQIYLPSANVLQFVRRFGGRGVYILTNVRTEREADELVAACRRLCRGHRRQHRPDA